MTITHSGSDHYHDHCIDELEDIKEQITSFLSQLEAAQASVPTTLTTPVPLVPVEVLKMREGESIYPRYYTVIEYR